MKISQLVLAEFRRLFSSPMSILALVALIFVPVLYGGLYLWANQDPYERLGNIPVALVVSDTGATIGTEHQNLGESAAQAIAESGTFDWQLVSHDEAQLGLEQGNYDFSVEFPADFSSDVASLAGVNPKQARIILQRNDANNYLASTIGTQAMAQIQTTVTEQIVSQSSLTILDALADIKTSLGDAASGASELSSGSISAQDGISQLLDGATNLTDGLNQLSSGTVTLSEGTAALAEVADRVGQSANEITQLLPQLNSDLEKQLREAGVPEAEITKITAKLNQLNSRADELNAKAQHAVSEIDQLNNGATALKNGSTEAFNGSTALKDGIGTLGNGMTQLSEGIAALHEGLAQGADQIPASSKAQREAQAAAIAQPIIIENEAISEAQNYGAGLAPFFAALAAWIGIYALFLIVKPVSKRAVTAMYAPTQITIAAWLTPAILGIVQMLALFGVLSLALGFHFEQPALTLTVLILASMAYATIVLCLNIWLGAVGQFLGLVLMVLQLVTAGGTFPWQTLPEPLAALHHILPMGYVVDALRQAMYGGDLARIGLDLGVLAIWAVAALALSTLGVAKLTRHRTMRDLEPNIIQ